VTTGRQDVGSFADSAACHWLIRVVEARDDLPPLKNGRYIFARGPFHFDGELALLRDERIDLLISKNSGGTATRAKLDAAATLGLPVVMVTRPTLPSGPVAHDLTAVERWLDEA